jgi:prepilin-type N-terminal cleavage/methylation domain-containing protein
VRAGFTIIELMVALAIASVLLVALSRCSSHQRRA